MTITIGKSDGGVGLFVCIGETKGHTWQAAFHKDDKWFAVYHWKALHSVGITLFKVGLILDTWTWTVKR